MRHRFDKYFPWLFIGSDFLFSAFAIFILLSIFNATDSFKEVGIKEMFPLFFFWLAVSSLRKDYEIGRTEGFDKTLMHLTGTIFWFLGAAAVLWEPFHTPTFQIVPIGLLGFGMFFFMGAFRIWIQILLRRYRAGGGNLRNAVILGKEGSSSRLVEIFKIKKEFGVNFLGYYDDLSDSDDTKGKIEDFFEQAPLLDLDFVYINADLDPMEVKRIIDFAEEHHIKPKLIPRASLQLGNNLSFSRYGDFFVVNINEIPLDNYFNSLLKRLFDLIFSSLVIVFILSWMVPLFGILIKMGSKGPVFFVQKRNGVGNKEFNCLKFRSMRANKNADTQQATKNDPRVTKFGAFLRKSSLDEMPQFLNVFMGDMSVIGPRPHTVPMNRTFQSKVERYNSRHKVKPGITGLAQIKGFRGEIDNPVQIRSRVRLDTFYVNNWTFMMDMSIIIETIQKVFFNQENAY